MKFHLTIKNNETGEVLRDTDCNAIIGGITYNEKKTCVALTECNWKELMNCAMAADEAISKVIPDQLRSLFTFLR